ncbi:MAG TPA: redoxin family protein [Bryobacteraceae bacterium]|nr:redoxin family protein [Bryobacteraceae bacterium]
MKRLLPVIMLLGPGAFGLGAADNPPTLAIGAAAPGFSLPAVDGKTYGLSDFDSSKVLVVVFTCVHCPTAQLYEGRIKKLAADYRDKGVALVAIQPNDPKSVRLDELGYTDMSDSFEEMKIRAAYRQFNFPFLYDGETQSVARAYGPTATPHVFVFDRARKLRYQGRVDSSQREALAKIADARNAIDAVLADKPVGAANTPTVGCSIKWAYKEASGQEEMAQIEREPVTVELAGPDRLKELRANSKSGKLLLVNFWATWCGPCTLEFPELQKMFRMYRHRKFDLVTVSTNFPDEKKGVIEFLQKQHASTRNLLFGTEDTYGQMAAFDPQWNAGVPYTMLIGMDGQVLYKKQGPIEPLEVRRAILANLPDDDYIGQQAYWRSK